MPVFPAACALVAAISLPVSPAVPHAPEGDGDRPPAISLRLAQHCPSGVATTCSTPYGACPLSAPLCRGSPCFCPTNSGPIWGVAQ